MLWNLNKLLNIYYWTVIDEQIFNAMYTLEMKVIAKLFSSAPCSI